MTHELDEENEDLCNKLQRLRFCTLEFVPPLIVLSTLPCAIHADVVAKDSASESVCFELKPGQNKEICGVNTGGKWLNFGVQIPGMSRTEILLPRKDGFTKELQLRCTSSANVQEHVGASNVLRMLFTVRVSDCGQMHIDVFSPVWIMNKSGISIDVMIPKWQSFYQMGACLTQEDNDVVSCKPLHGNGQQTQLQLLGYSGTELAMFIATRYIVLICHYCVLMSAS